LLECVGPSDVPEVPFRKSPRLGGDNEILLKARIGSADFRVGAVEDHPELIALLGQIGEVEAHDGPVVRESVVIQVLTAPGLEHDARVQVLGSELYPAFTPSAKCQHDLAEVSASCS
jgi:hypothetical protein